MERLTHKRVTKQRRRARVRSTVSGTANRPRLSVYFSHTNIIAQIIDDELGRTLVQASSVGKKMPGPMMKKAAVIGQEIAQKAKGAKIKQVVFDRGGHIYHGRIAALADAARKEGLEF
jgi:large subunit ribosomal protein L18